MPHSLASLLVHAIFSTKNRLPDLTPDLAVRLFPHMGGIVRERNGIATIINGPLDHVHLLLSLPTTESLADLHPPNGSRGNGNSAGKRDTRPPR